MRKPVMLAMGICLLVLAVTLTSCQSGASTPPPPPMTLYENAEHGFSIEYPEGWTEKSREAATSFSFQFNDPEGRLSVDISVDYKPEEISLAKAVSEGKGYMESVPQLEMISEGNVTIGEGVSGYKMIGKGDIVTEKEDKFRYVVLVRDKQVFWVGVYGEPATFDEQKQLVDTIIDSFELLSNYTFVPPALSPGGTYTNAEYGFSMTYPAGWTDTTTGQYGEIVDLQAAEGIPEVMVRSWTEETTLAEAAANLKQMYSENIGNYELLAEGEITLDDGTPAYEFVFKGTMEGYLLKCKCVTVIQETEVFLLMGFSLPGSFEQDEPILDEIISSFHLE